MIVVVVVAGCRWFERETADKGFSSCRDSIGIGSVVVVAAIFIGWAISIAALLIGLTVTIRAAVALMNNIPIAGWWLLLLLLLQKLLFPRQRLDGRRRSIQPGIGGIAATKFALFGRCRCRTGRR